MAGTSIRTAESIGKLVKLTASTLSLPASRISIGPMQYVTSALTLNTATIGVGGVDATVTSSAIYTVYAVVSSNVVYLIASLNATLPAGFTQARAVGGFSTDTSSQIDQVASTPGDLNVLGTGNFVSGLIAPPVQNFLINGGFDFNQRFGTGNHTATNTYGLDRWWMQHNHTTVAISKQDITLEYANVRSCMRLYNTTRGAGSYLYVMQPIETSNVIPLLGKTITYSLSARRSSGLASGTLFIEIDGHTGTDTAVATLASAGTLIAKTTIANADLSTTWKKYSITMVIPTGYKTIGCVIGFAGSPTDGQYIDVKEVMLNIGTSAAPFQRAGGTIGGELALCQRYYCKSFNIDVPAAQNSGSSSGAISYMTLLNGANYHTLSVKFPVSMRAVPNPVTFYSINTATAKWSNLSSGLDSATGSYTQEGHNGFKATNPQVAGDLITHTIAVHYSADAEL